MEKNVNNYKSRFYTYLLFVSFIIIESFGLVWFVTNEKQKAEKKYTETTTLFENAKNEIQRISHSIDMYKQYSSIWESIPEAKKQRSKKNANDMKVFLNSIANGFGFENLSVNIITANSVLQNANLNSQQFGDIPALPNVTSKDLLSGTFFEKIVVQVKYDALTEGSIFMFLDAINSDEMMFFAKRIQIEKIKLPQGTQGGITNAVKTKLEDGNKHVSLTGAVSANITLEYYIIK